jgi:hypothetical protein
VLLRNGWSILKGTQNPLLEGNLCREGAAPGEGCEEPNLQAIFDRCMESDSGVRYVITGEGVNSVSLTWQNDTGGTEQADFLVPFCEDYDGFSSGDFLYISAQIRSPTSGAGSITCRIYDGTTVIAEANAYDFASIATCSGSAK